MGVKVRVDLKGWDQVRRAIVKTEQRVKIGVLEDKSGEETEDGISMIEMFAIHEFGSPEANIPERSSLRSTVNGKHDEIGEAIDQIVGGEVKRLLEGDSVSESQAEAAARRALGKLGAKVVSMVKATIRARETEGPEDQENKPATIARKGSDLPLVDTGQLINALTWSVVNPGEEDG